MLPVGEFWLSFRPEAFRNTTIMDIMTNYGFNLRVEITAILHTLEDGVKLSDLHFLHPAGCCIFSSSAFLPSLHNKPK